MAKFASDIIGTLQRVGDDPDEWKVVGDDGREHILRPHDVLYIPSVLHKGKEEPWVWTWVITNDDPSHCRLWHRTEEYGEVFVVPMRGMRVRCI